MKLSISQMASGVLIVLAACYIVGWMIFGAQSLLNMPLHDQDGVLKMTDLLPKHEVLFTSARYASGLLFGLALAVLVTGTIQVAKAGERKTKLTLTQVIAGVLVVSVSIFIMGWGYPVEFIIPMPAGSNLVGHVNINPGPTMIFAVFLTAVTFLLGLAVAVVGIAQFVKARRFLR